MIVLSHVQIEPLLAARIKDLPDCHSSADLGLSQIIVTFREGGVVYPTGEKIPWSVLEEANSNPNACYRLVQDSLQPIQAYSVDLDRFYSLYPTRSAPTMLISGIPMHRVKDSDPWQDSLSKIKAASIKPDKVLDTATGLGYTAILAARTASQVITVELDATVQQVTIQSPWSQGLFSNPKINRIIGDSYAVIQGFPEGEFSRIIHDPPMFCLGGELYSWSSTARHTGY
jgi:hypothetical protein